MSTISTAWLGKGERVTSSYPLDKTCQARIKIGMDSLSARAAPSRRSDSGHVTSVIRDRLILRLVTQ